MASTTMTATTKNTEPSPGNRPKAAPWFWMWVKLRMPDRAGIGDNDSPMARVERIHALVY